MTVVVVVPTYNEAASIRSVIEGVLETFSDMGLRGLVLVVDDNSPDGTANVVKQLAEEKRCIILLRRSGRLGIGSAYIYGFRYVLNNVTDLEAVVEMDADGSHDPRYLGTILEPVLAGRADVTVGSRYVEGGGWAFSNPVREIISRLGNFVARSCTGVVLRDMTSGYRAVSAPLLRKTIDKLSRASSGYVFQVESLAVYAAEGARIVEVPIVFKCRLGGRSKLGIGDISVFLAWNVRHLFKRLST